LISMSRRLSLPGVEPTNRLAPRVDPGGHAVMSRRYQVLAPTAPVPAPDDLLEQMAREGAQRLLQAALRAEVDNFLQRGRYQRAGEFRGTATGTCRSGA
jgi:hypothetical protein